MTDRRSTIERARAFAWRWSAPTAAVAAWVVVAAEEGPARAIPEAFALTTLTLMWRTSFQSDDE